MSSHDSHLISMSPYTLQEPFLWCEFCMDCRGAFSDLDELHAHNTDYEHEKVPMLGEFTCKWPDCAFAQDNRNFFNVVNLWFHYFIQHPGAIERMPDETLVILKNELDSELTGWIYCFQYREGDALHPQLDAWMYCYNRKDENEPVECPKALGDIRHIMCAKRGIDRECHRRGMLVYETGREPTMDEVIYQPHQVSLLGFNDPGHEVDSLLKGFKPFSI